MNVLLSADAFVSVGFVQRVQFTPERESTRSPENADPRNWDGTTVPDGVCHASFWKIVTVIMERPDGTRYDVVSEPVERLDCIVTRDLRKTEILRAAGYVTLPVDAENVWLLYLKPALRQVA